MGRVKKRDLLLLMIAISGEMPYVLAREVVGSNSYAAAIITELKQEGYISVRNKFGCKGYVLKAKGKRYMLEKYSADTEYFLQGTIETNHVKSELEKRMRLYRMSKAWVFWLKMGIPIFRSQKPELLGTTKKRWNGEMQIAYYGSLEFKSGVDSIKGSRACGLFVTGESGYIVYHSMSQKMKWAKKMERSMRVWAERLFMQKGIWGPVDALIIGDEIELLCELLESEGGIKGNLYQVDDIFERSFFMPMCTEAEIQIQLLQSKSKKTALYDFLCGILDTVENKEYSVHAGFDKDGEPVYFCYELEMRHLKRVKQELGWKKRGSILCLEYQSKVLKKYFGEEVEIREILTEKVKQYLQKVGP